MSDYPRTIDNGHGERITFMGPRHDASGEWFDVVNEVQPGCGPAMHLHPSQVETLTVRCGTLGYVMGDSAVRYVHAGESVTFEANVAHRFWNAGDDVLRCEGSISPPLRFEEFLTKLFASMARHGGRPGLRDVARLVHDYRPEGRMTKIPWFVETLVFPLLRRL